MHSFYSPEPSQLIESVVHIAVSAGMETLRYFCSDFSIAKKSNYSPVTDADIAANDIIVNGLNQLEPRLPILSEEMSFPRYTKRSKWRRFWMIDPIDGTKAFIQDEPEFTVNIALIEGSTPILGVVNCPVDRITYWGVKGMGAYRKDDTRNITERIQVKDFKASPARIIAPNSRGRHNIEKFVNALNQADVECEISHLSSSYKFCRVAEGEFDLFPSFASISEWDVAAGHCVVESAGGKMLDFNGRPIRYNKRDLSVPPFLVHGGGEFPWKNYLPRN